MDHRIKIVGLLFIILSLLFLSGCDDSQYDETFSGSWEIIKVDDIPHPSYVSTKWTFLENGTVKVTTTTSQVHTVRWSKFFVNESAHQLSQINIGNNSYEMLYTYEFIQGGKQLVLTRIAIPATVITLERI